MDTVRIGRTVLATLFMDILRGKDLLCWQHLIVILSRFYLLPPPPPRVTPPPKPGFSFLRLQVTPPLSLHSDTSDAGTLFFSQISFCSPGKNLRLIRMINWTLHNPVKSPVLVGRDSSVGIANGYGLDGPGIGSWWWARFSAPVQTLPGVHPASCTMGTGTFRGVKSGRGMTLTPHPLLVPWSWKGRAIPLLPLWAVRPVQSLSACTRVTFTFTFYPSIETDCSCTMNTNSVLLHDFQLRPIGNYKPGFSRSDVDGCLYLLGCEVMEVSMGVTLHHNTEIFGQIIISMS